ncbi:hypothetical protein [Hyphomicrobium sp. MC1]|uniref:hypothetical protein n=1 Tax=Hyphomicrobium sp. (strain MC1) TaxID=717785 RepID=UPI0012F49486|nr:hypothetical protein [Hyphomicrobium sp. MC1]
MYSLETYSPRPPHFMALFNDGTESFLLSRRTTLAELAEFLDELGWRHDSAPLAVQVQFEAPSLATMDRTSSRLHA